jgi:cell division protein ZapD
VYDIGIFEQPLNERFRLMLRIEQLFARMDHHLAGEDPWDTHAALQALMELLQMVARGDSKRELIQELDRQRAALGRQRAHDEQSEHDQLLEALHSGTGALGEELRGNTLLGQLQQRSTAGGRPGMLELPSYQEWLQRPAADRHADVRVWLQPMVPARRAIDRALSMVRESGQWQTIQAPGGFHEQSLESGHPIQMLRLALSDGGPANRFPEISAGRQRYTIRFFTQGSPAERATQITADVSFRLACCGL